MTEIKRPISLNLGIFQILSLCLICEGLVSNGDATFNFDGQPQKHLMEIGSENPLNQNNLFEMSESLRTKRDAFETLKDLTSYFGAKSSRQSSSPQTQLLVERRLHNTSVAITIPMFTFTLPYLQGGGFLVNQAIFGIFSLGVLALTFIISFIFTGMPPSNAQSRSMERVYSKAKDSPLNFMGKDLSGTFGMDGLECLQKIICQAHRSPQNRKYGVIASSVRMLFPGPSNTIFSENEDSAVQSAAIAGKFSKEACEKLYDCIIDGMDSARYLVHWYGHTHSNARFLLNMIDDQNNDQSSITSAQDFANLNQTLY